MKQFTKSCEQCGRTFFAKRTTARFCSANCRVKWNRTHVSIEEKYQLIIQLTADIGHELDKKQYCYEAAIALQHVAKFANYFMPNLTQWWHCDNCHNSVMKFIPDADNCPCGKKAKWFILNTD